MSETPVVETDPETQYAMYLAERLEQSYDYGDWHELTFGKKPEESEEYTAKERVVRVINTIAPTLGKKLLS